MAGMGPSRPMPASFLAYCGLRTPRWQPLQVITVIPNCRAMDCGPLHGARVLGLTSRRRKSAAEARRDYDGRVVAGGGSEYKGVPDCVLELEGFPDMEGRSD